MPDQGFAADLESLRLDAGLSLRALVRSTGIPRSTLSDALAGRRAPRLETVMAIARACGADPDAWRRRWTQLARERRTGGAGTGRARGSTAPVPAQLPRDVAGFASREHEMALLDRAGIAVIHGPPGIGKTTLAVHWAHARSARYPDGQLFLNLRGHHPTLDPMSATEALGRLLGALDVPWVPASEDPDEGANLWRSMVAGRRLLIVLDDAVSAAQVRPLLPGEPGSTTLVTSRHYLADLLLYDAAEGLALDVLDARSAVTLLSQVVGAARVETELDAAVAVAMACGYLPLGLRLAGAVVAAAPGRRFVHLLDQLTGGDRLTALEGLARPSAVESAFELSYRALPEAARLLFRRLGLHPGSEIGAQAAALLTGLGQDQAGGLLRTLAEAHLVEPDRPGRYRLHDLLRDYAARLVNESDSAEQRDAARQRLLEWYLDRALAVSSTLNIRQRTWVADDLRSSWNPGDGEAAAWLEAEHHNVVAAIEYDAMHGTGGYAWALTDLVAGPLFRRHDVSGLLVATSAALAAAQRHGEPHAEGAMCLERGWLRWRCGQSDGAAEDFARAQSLLRDVGARRLEASALRGLSASYVDTGRPDEARRCAEAGLAICREEGDRAGQASSLGNLAVIADRTADFPAAEAYIEQSIALHREAGRRASVALGLANLAEVYLIRGALTRAIRSAEEATAVARDLGDGLSESIALANGASAHEQNGCPDEAHRWATAALARAQKMGHPFAEAVALNALASASRRLGRGESRAYRSRALRRAHQAGLGTVAEVLVGGARDAYQDALDSTTPADRAFRAGHDAARRALDAALAAGSLHDQAEALGLLAACDLGLGKVTDALGDARQAVQMHVTSGARLAEVSARCVLAHALFRDADAAAARNELRVAGKLLDEAAVPEAAPVRRLLGAAAASSLPLFA